MSLIIMIRKPASQGIRYVNMAADSIRAFLCLISRLNGGECWKRWKAMKPVAIVARLATRYPIVEGHTQANLQGARLFGVCVTRVLSRDRESTRRTVGEALLQTF
jgi:hypothetical protein